MYSIFDSLWTQIKKDIDYAVQNSFPVGLAPISAAGDLANRDMTIHQPLPNGAKETSVRLDQEKHRIEVSGMMRATFPIVISNGDVCLKDEKGNIVEIAEASRRILDPLMFPDLQKPDISQ